MKNEVVLVGALTVLGFSLVALPISIYKIDQGETGVVLRGGKVIDQQPAGLHLKIPFFDKIVKISNRTITMRKNKVLTYSYDQQPADIQISITFSVSPQYSKDVYQHFKDIDTLYSSYIEPILIKETKTVFGGFTALKSIQQRDKLNNDIFVAVSDAIKDHKEIYLQSIQVENIDFSDSYEETIEQRMKAEVEVERYKQNLERQKIEAQIAITKAQGEADSQVKKAEAEAKTIILKAKAEADGIELKAKALRDNPLIIELTKAQQWDGKLPITMLPNSSVPMVKLDNLNKEEKDNVQGN